MIRKVFTAYFVYLRSAIYVVLTMIAAAGMYKLVTSSAIAQEITNWSFVIAIAFVVLLFLDVRLQIHVVPYLVFRVVNMICEPFQKEIAKRSDPEHELVKEFRVIR